MNKETLGQYGWVVICVIVLAIMITFATPFGNKIAGEVVETVTNMTSSANTALDEISVGGYDGGVGGAGGGAGGGEEETWEDVSLLDLYASGEISTDYYYDTLTENEFGCGADSYLVFNPGNYDIEFDFGGYRGSVIIDGNEIYSCTEGVGTGSTSFCGEVNQQIRVDLSMATITFTKLKKLV